MPWETSDCNKIAEIARGNQLRVCRGDSSPPFLDRKTAPVRYDAQWGEYSISSAPAKIPPQDWSIVQATPHSQRTTKLRPGNLSPKFDKNSALRGGSCANIRLTEVSMARLDEGRWSSHPMAVVRRGCPVLPWDPTKPQPCKNSSPGA